MASSYGEDASKNALQSLYQSALASLPERHRIRVEGDIASHLRALPAYRKTSLLLAYVAYHEEIDTTAIIQQAWRDGKKVALPVVVGGARSLAYYLVDSLDGLVRGARGALEPAVALDDDPVPDDELAGSLCLVPGLVFDARGYRIDYGAGYFDNFLAAYPGLKVGLARGFQISSNPLPSDEHDIAVDVLVSDGAIWWCER